MEGRRSRPTTLVDDDGRDRGSSRDVQDAACWTRLRLLVGKERRSAWARRGGATTSSGHTVDEGDAREVAVPGVEGDEAGRGAHVQPSKVYTTTGEPEPPSRLPGQGVVWGTKKTGAGLRGPCRGRMRPKNSRFDSAVLGGGADTW